MRLWPNSCIFQPIYISLINPMRILLLSLCLCSTLMAQQLGWVRYPVAYEIQKLGHPPVKFATIEGGRFFYVEYWPEGPDKAVTGYYLQSVKPQIVEGQEEYVEAWNKPIRYANDADMDPRYLQASTNSICLAGRAKVGGNEATMVQYYGMDGSYIGKQQYLSPYRKSLGNYRDYYYPSADKRLLCWMGYNPDEPASKRSYYASVYSDDGRKVWGEELRIPEVNNRRVVCDAAVDLRGNLYVALVDEAPTGLEADKQYKPVIARYDYKAKTWSTKTLEFEGTSCSTVRLYPTAGEELIAISLIMKGETGVPNALNAAGKMMYMTDMLYHKLNMRTTNLAELATWQNPLPENFVKRYKDETEGAQFSGYQWIEKDDQLVLLMEQSYEKVKTAGRVYFRKDVGMISLSVSKNELQWVNYMDKNQNDFGDSRIGYTPAITDMFIHFVYMSDVGGDGKLMLSSVNRETGEHIDKELGENRSGNLFFFTQRSVQTEPGRVVLLGLGDPKRNEYTLTHIKGLP